MKWIDNLGRATRSHADTTMENILGHLSRVALEHETDVHGKSKWVLGSKTTGEAEGEFLSFSVLWNHMLTISAEE